MLLALSVATGAQAQQAVDFTDYVVQSICIDAAGRPVHNLPVDAACAGRRLQWSDDVATYRKHDWPNILAEPSTVLAYQASDSVLERRNGRTIVVQTFDFGTGGRSFGHFDALKGDGGQVLVFVDRWASFAMTEDGGGGVQWFLGEACGARTKPDARFVGWLVFRQDIVWWDWQSAVARLNIAPTADDCPGRFNFAFTRFRLEAIEMPFRIVETDAPARLQFHKVDAIVSEHYGGRDVKTADHLERFYLAKGLGLVRWERWANGNLPQPPSIAAAHHTMTTTDRCPPLEAHGAPTTGWLLVDCRMWTTLVHQSEPWRVRDFAWPALRAFGALD